MIKKQKLLKDQNMADGQNQKRKLSILAISGLPLWGLGDMKGMPSLYEGVKAFIRNGHEVHFITCFPPLYVDISRKKHHGEYIQENIIIHEFSMPFCNILKRLKAVNYSANRFARLFQYLVRLFTEYITWIMFTLKALHQARKVYKKHPPDVVYAYNEMAALSGYFVAKVCGVPNITRLFGTFLHEVLLSKGFWFRYIVAISGFKVPSQYLIVGDDGTKGNLVGKHLHVEEGRLIFWRNGVDIGIYDPIFNVAAFKKELGIDSKVQVVLSLCRLEMWKGVHRLIDAIPLVVSKHNDVLFLIVGDGNQKAALQNQVDDLKVSNWTRFLGIVDRQQVKKLMNLADIFVTLQDLSNMSNVLLEAFAAGKCIVTVKDGSTDDLIKDGFSGCFIDKNDRKSIAECMIKLLSDEVLIKRISENARRLANERLETWEQRTDREVALIERLVREKE